MKVQEFHELTAKQQHVLLVSMYLRNAMEDFHVAHLTDRQMAELNPIVRQALFDILTMIEQDHHPNYAARVKYLIDMIPSTGRYRASRLPGFVGMTPPDLA